METQTGWRWCGRCQDLAYGGSGNGICFDGTPHNFAGSGPYVVPIGEVSGLADIQEHWKWCNRCQVLINIALGAGICHDGAQHRYRGSGDYGVRIGPAPAGFQDGWRLCGRCFALTYAGFGQGVCWDGEPHDTTASPDYSLTVEPDVPSVPVPPPPAPTVAVDESGGSLYVTGAHYTAHSAVRLSFVCGGDVVKFELTAGESGTFAILLDDFDDECSAGAVIAVDLTTEKFALGRVVNLFPQVDRPLPPVVIDYPEKGLDPA